MPPSAERESKRSNRRSAGQETFLLFSFLSFFLFFALFVEKEFSYPPPNDPRESVLPIDTAVAFGRRTSAGTARKQARFTGIDIAEL
jgi:hypothetical protein